MALLKELTIVTPNKPGKLAQVLRAIAAAKINIRALDSSSGYDLNMVRLITSDQRRTKSILEKLGHEVTESVVLGDTVPDKPGSLLKFTSAFGKAKVNIDYMYMTAALDGSPSLVVFHLSDLDAAQRAIKTAGLA